jgi:hypothetical protein
MFMISISKHWLAPAEDEDDRSRVEESGVQGSTEPGGRASGDFENLREI